MAENLYKKGTMAFAGYVSIAGAISMFVGAALWGLSGTHLWQALASNQMDNYLSQLAPVKHFLVACTIFWTLGVLLMGTSGALMSRFCTSKPALAYLSLAFLRCAIPVAVVSFFIMLSLAIHPPSLDSATTIGWIGARLDDLATILIIGTCPLFISLAGRRDWIPSWLAIWGYFAGFAGLLSVISMLTGLMALGFVIIPFGLGWMIAAGVVLIKKD